jgi:uncharacterized protein YecE (DUF72 family)
VFGSRCPGSAILPSDVRTFRGAPPGWNYDHWRPGFYPRDLPKRRWLEHYATRFYTVEVNSTFYRLASASAVQHWLEQTPPGFVFAVKDELPRGRHAFEFRHRSWFAEDVLSLPRERDVALVIGDHPERPYQRFELTAAWTLVRLHYGHRGRRGNYSDAELATWARRLGQWRRRAEIYACFNIDWERFAPRNAPALRRRLTPG